mmetsp:Transcript_420/g.1085  ORF Transcript_420/g.1085 Transcript_420/m.1085 type:complete len:253 (-) Transcript_420:346-1104(-)
MITRAASRSRTGLARSTAFSKTEATDLMRVCTSNEPGGRALLSAPSSAAAAPSSAAVAAGTCAACQRSTALCVLGTSTAQLASTKLLTRPSIRIARIAGEIAVAARDTRRLSASRVARASRTRPSLPYAHANGSTGTSGVAFAGANDVRPSSADMTQSIATRATTEGASAVGVPFAARDGGGGEGGGAKAARRIVSMHASVTGDGETCGRACCCSRRCMCVPRAAGLGKARAETAAVLIAAAPVATETRTNA